MKIQQQLRKPTQKEKEQLLPILKTIETKIRHHTKHKIRYKITISDHNLPFIYSIGNMIIITSGMIGHFNQEELTGAILNEMCLVLRGKSRQRASILGSRLIGYIPRSCFNLILKSIEHISSKTFFLFPFMLLTKSVRLLLFSMEQTLLYVWIKSSNRFERSTDRFVINLGYRKELLSYLEKESMLNSNFTIFNNKYLNRTPSTKRILAIEKLTNSVSN